MKVNGEWLAELTESVTCEVTLTLRDGDHALFTQKYPLEALAKNGELTRLKEMRQVVGTHKKPVGFYDCLSKTLIYVACIEAI